jgi:hypothetical protein
MPPWSPLGGEQRDIYGELAWIPNFQVTTSKDNNKMHHNYKEYFDKPRNYHLAASSSSAASSEFFKQNAPKGSVARPRRIGGDSLSSSGFLKTNFNNTQTSFGGGATSPQNQKDLLFSATATTQNSAFASINGGSPYSTPFILMEERHNKYKIDDRLKQTVPLKNAIPFLRVNDDDYKQVVKLSKKGTRATSIQMSEIGSP